MKKLKNGFTSMYGSERVHKKADMNCYLSPRPHRWKKTPRCRPCWRGSGSACSCPLLWTSPLGRSGQLAKLSCYSHIRQTTIQKLEGCRGIIVASSHAKLKVQSPPPTALLRMRGGPHICCSSVCILCSNGHPAIQLKYMYSTLLLALLLGCVVYASATLVTDSTRSPSKHGASQTPSAAH